MKFYLSHQNGFSWGIGFVTPCRLHLSVDVELHACDVVVVTNELVENDIVGPMPLPDSNYMIKSTLENGFFSIIVVEILGLFFLEKINSKFLMISF